MMDTRKGITMAARIYHVLVKITQRTIVHGTAMAMRMAKLSTTTMPIVQESSSSGTSYSQSNPHITINNIIPSSGVP